MSNDICGFVEFNPGRVIEISELVGLAESYCIGLREQDVRELYNFPSDMLPAHANNTIVFGVNDGGGAKNATYLIDALDYAPEAEIGLPTNWRDRLRLLVNFLIDLASLGNVSRLVVALTDSSQIERISNVDMSDIDRVIFGDVENAQGAPNTLYEIGVSSENVTKSL